MTGRDGARVARHIRDFLESYAPAHLTSSEHTLRSYRTALTLYVGYLAESGIGPSQLGASCFERAVIEGWLEWLSSARGCSPQTCNVRLAALRSFLTYLSGRDAAFAYLADEGGAVPCRKAPRRHVEGMSRRAVAALLAAPDQTTRSGRRDAAFMVLMYSTAARLDELLGMRVSQLRLDHARPHALLIGKGRKVRTAYLAPGAVDHVRAYLDEFHGVAPDPDDLVFYSRNKGKGGKLSQTAISKMLRKHAATAHASCAEVPLGAHAHQLRHAKASHWLEDGMNIVQISFLLGHASITTTMAYLDVTTEAELAAIATLESERASHLRKKWRDAPAGLSEFCGLRPL